MIIEKWGESHIMHLTNREKEVLRLFCYKNDDIAQILCLSVGSVKAHTHNILKKLEEPTKIRALIKAVKMGIINISAIETDIKDLGFWDEYGVYKIDMQRIKNERKI